MKHPRRLHHTIPSWVKPGSLFHVRIRSDGSDLADDGVANTLLDSARFYHESARWHLRVFLVMPDHIHMIVAVPSETGMSETVANWKRYCAKQLGISWQDNFFDHRLRNDEELALKLDYIRNNPVASSLCSVPEDWKWVYCPESR